MIDQDRLYLRKQEVATRYDMSISKLDRLVNHVDHQQRFPPPSLYMGRTPYWLIADLDAFDVRQIELSKQREVRQLGEQYMKKRNPP